MTYCVLEVKLQKWVSSIYLKKNAVRSCNVDFIFLKKVLTPGFLAKIYSAELGGREFFEIGQVLEPTE